MAGSLATLTLLICTRKDKRKRRKDTSSNFPLLSFSIFTLTFFFSSFSFIKKIEQKLQRAPRYPLYPLLPLLFLAINHDISVERVTADGPILARYCSLRSIADIRFILCVAYSMGFHSHKIALSTCSIIQNIIVSLP